MSDNMDSGQPRLTKQEPLPWFQAEFNCCPHSKLWIYLLCACPQAQACDASAHSHVSRIKHDPRLACLWPCFFYKGGNSTLGKCLQKLVWSPMQAHQVTIFQEAGPQRACCPTADNGHQDLIGETHSCHPSFLLWKALTLNHEAFADLLSFHEVRYNSELGFKADLILSRNLNWKEGSHASGSHSEP